jgi:hypothetical protein
MSRTLKISNFSYIKRYVESVCNKCKNRINFNNFYLNTDGYGYKPLIYCNVCVESDLIDYDEYPEKDEYIINEWPEKPFSSSNCYNYNSLVEGKCRVCLKKYNVGDEYVELSTDFMTCICCEECMDNFSFQKSMKLIHFLKTKIKLPRLMLNLKISFKVIKEFHHCCRFLWKFDYLQMGPVTEWVPIFSNITIQELIGSRQAFILYRSRDNRIGFLSYNNRDFSQGSYLTIYPSYVTLQYYLQKYRKWKPPTNSYVYKYDNTTLRRILRNIGEDLEYNYHRTDKTFLPDLFNWVLENQLYYYNPIFKYHPDFLRVVDNFHSHFFYEFMSRTFTQTLKKIPLTSKSSLKLFKSHILIK